MATCRYGDTPPARKVALVGDSHAEQWRGALHEIARAENWEIVELLRGGCPVTSARVLTFEGGRVDTEGCARWGQQVDEYLQLHPFDDVLTSSFTTAFTFDSDDGVGSFEAGTRGFARTWIAWAASGARVHVIRDVPTTAGRHLAECLMTADDSPLRCSRPRSEAVVPDAAMAAVDQLASENVELVDLTDFFCDETTCYAAIGGAVVYWDANHMSAQFSRTLAPYLLGQLDGDT